MYKKERKLMRCPRCGCEVMQGDKFCQRCGAKLDVVKKTKKINKKKVLIAGVIIVGLGIAGGAMGFTYNNFSKDKNAYIYFSDGSYKLLSNLKKDSSINLSDGNADGYDKEGLVTFSPDGKYVYYYSEYDTSNYSGTLYRSEVAKLSKNSERNEKYTDFIGNNIHASFKCVKDNGIVYKDTSNNLYYYNGKESVRIAKSILNYGTDGSEKIIYTVSNEDATDDRMETLRLYGISIDKPEEKKKMASDVDYIVDQGDFDNILYSKLNSEDGLDLYVVGFDKERECLGKNASTIYYQDGGIYYTAQNGNTVNLYDYVDDPKKDADKSQEKEENVYYEPLDWYCYEDDYDEIYTSCTQACTFLDNEEENTIEKQSEDEFQAFTKKYKALENSAGYFVVNEEIKQDLIKLTEDYGEGDEDEWLEFCFSKETESESSEEEMQEEYLNSLRTQLKDKANNYKLRDLCYYKDGKISTISKDVVATKGYANCFAYATKDMITNKIKLEDVNECEDVKELFKVTLNDQSCLIPYDSNLDTITFTKESNEYLKDVGSDEWIYVYYVGKNVYILEYSGTLMTASVKDSKVGKFSKVAENVSYRGKSDTSYYYSVEKDDGTYNDLYFCTDGESKLEAEDIDIDTLAVYDDGTVIVTDLGTDYDLYELSTITESGKETIIADDVSEYAKVDDKNILYISDGDLYVYNGEERKLLSIDVDYFWVKDVVKTNFKNDGWS